MCSFIVLIVKMPQKICSIVHCIVGGMFSYTYCMPSFTIDLLIQHAFFLIITLSYWIYTTFKSQQFSGNWQQIHSMPVEVKCVYIYILQTVILINWEKTLINKPLHASQTNYTALGQIIWFICLLKHMCCRLVTVAP